MPHHKIKTMTARQKYEQNKQKLSDLYETLFKCQSLESMNDITLEIDLILFDQEQIIEEYKTELRNKLNQN